MNNVEHWSVVLRVFVICINLIKKENCFLSYLCMFLVSKCALQCMCKDSKFMCKSKYMLVVNFRSKLFKNNNSLRCLNVYKETSYQVHENMYMHAKWANIVYKMDTKGMWVSWGNYNLLNYLLNHLSIFWYNDYFIKLFTL